MPGANLAHVDHRDAVHQVGRHQLGNLELGPRHEQHFRLGEVGVRGDIHPGEASERE